MLTDDQLAVNDIDGAPTKESSRAKRSLNAATMPPKNDFHHTWANGVVPYQWSATIGKTLIHIINNIYVV